MAQFRARALGELERKSADVPWTRFLGGGPVRFRIAAGRSRIYHERAAEERLRGALGRAGIQEEPPRADAAAALVVVRIYRDEVTISADASGEHLHRRGYRTRPGMAPLRETLAAAALRATGWTGQEDLVDPFAGSGTIPIEAALLALRIPPGLATADRSPRAFAFLNWPGAPREAFAAAAEDARQSIRTESPARILASDRDAGAIRALEENAEAAGVAHAIEVTTTPFGQARLPATGLLLTNPPYGARLGDRRRLRSLYRAFGERVGATALRIAFFEADRVLALETGLPLHDAFATRNGGLKVRLALADPPSEPVVDDDGETPNG
jgi:putative N6-adenine-specific DNA methylase